MTRRGKNNSGKRGVSNSISESRLLIYVLFGVVISGLLALVVSQGGNGFNYFGSPTGKSISDLSLVDDNAELKESTESLKKSIEDLKTVVEGLSKYLSLKDSKGKVLNAQIIEGVGGVDVIPSEGPVKKITFRNLKASKSIALGIDSVESEGNFQKIYAIDPTQLEFDNATVYVDGTGESLYKCTEWNFTTATCGGRWRKLQDIVPGQTYNFTIDAKDPGFAETNLTVELLDNDHYLYNYTETILSSNSTVDNILINISDSTSVKSIKIAKDRTQNGTELHLANLSFNDSRIKEVLSIDATNFSLINLTLDKNSGGKDLIECTDWNSSLGKCSTNWTKVKNIAKNERYETLVTRNKTTYAETGDTVVVFDKNFKLLQYDQRVLNETAPVSDVEYEFKGLKVKKLKFYSYNKSSASNDLVVEHNVDVSSPSGKVTSTFSIDPTNLTFSYAELNATAQGKYLFKCVDWNASDQTCFGDWKRLRALTPGQDYLINITPQDPGFLETNNSIVLIDDDETLLNYNETQTLSLLEGEKKNFELTLSNSSTISKIEVFGFNESAGANQLRLKSELNNSPMGGAIKSYSIDPTNLSFDNATITVVATGNDLYKCANWSFSTQTCLDGNWTLFKTGLTPGQEYTFVLTAGDPGYAETGTHHAWLVYYNGTTPTLPKYRTWNGTLSNQADATDIGAGADAEWVVIKSSNRADDQVMVTLDDLGIVKAQVWRGTQQSWGSLQTISTGIGTTNDAQRGMDVAFEQNSGRAIVVASDGTATGVYDIWNGTAWAGAQPMITDGCTGVVIWTVLESKPNSNEILYVDNDANGDHCAQVWDGTTWTSPATLDTTPAGIELTQQFDAAYEASSGDALVTWENEGSTGEVFFNTYSGGSWGTSASTGFDSGGGGGNAFIRMASMPGSDRILIGTLDTENDLNLGEWNGTAFGTSATPDATTEQANGVYRFFDVAYMDSSGNAMAVYADLDADYPSYTTCSGLDCFAGTWSTPTNTTATTNFCGSAASDLAWLGLDSDPFSNKTYLWGKAQTNSGKCFQEFDGTNWGTWNSNLGAGSILVGTEDVYASADKFADTTGPAVTFVDPTPVNGFAQNTTSVTINVTSVDAEVFISSCTLEFDNVNTTMTKQGTGVSVSCNSTLTGLADGVHTYRVHSTNVAGINGSSELRTLTVDTVAPAVAVVPPTPNNNSYVNTSTIVFNATILDALTNVDICILNLDGVSSFMTKNGTGLAATCNSTQSVLAEGLHNFTISANDSVGNLRVNGTYFFIVDTINPQIVFVSPTPASGTHSIANSLAVNVTTSEINLANVTIRLFNSTGLVNETTFVTSPSFINYTGLADGIYFFNATAIDLAGNRNNTETRNFTVDTVNPAIQFVAPTETNGSLLTRNNIAVNVTSTDTNLANITIFLFNSTGFVNSSTTTTSPNFINFTGLADGIYFFNATAVDINGNRNNTETRNVLIDTLNPSIQFVAPTEANGSLLTRNNIAVNVTSTDANLANITISLFNSTGLVNSSTSTSSPYFLNFTGLPDGNYTFNATAIDLAGNRNNTETRNVLIDTATTQIQFVAPTEANGSVLNVSVIRINVTSTDNNLANITIRLFNSTSLLNTTTTTTSPNFINYTALPDGTYFFNATSVDLAGNTNSTETRSVIIDTVNPQIQFVAPTEANGSFLNVSVIRINVTSTDANLANITIRLFNSTGLVNSTTTTSSPNFINYTALPDGTYFFNATSVDLAGNTNSTETRSVIIDTANPQINFVAPTEANGTFVSRNSLAVNVTATDTNLANMTINLFNSTGLVNSSTSVSSPYFLNFTGLPDGTYFFNATAVDLAGNRNNTETRVVTIDTGNPQIRFVAPTETNGSVLNRNNLAINVTVTDVNLVNITIRLFNATSLLNTTTTTVSPNFINYTDLPDGTYFFNATSVDLAGNTNSTETRSVIIDTVNPQIQFVAPTEANGSFLNVSVIRINVTSTDANLANITIRLFNSTGLVNSTTTTSSPNFINYTALPDGIYFFNATAVDTSGRSNSTETRTVTVDRTPPAVFDLRPTAGTNVTTSQILEISANVTDSNGVSAVIANLTLPNGTVIKLVLLNASGAKYNTSFTVPLLTGNYTVRFIANDTLNNVNFTETTFFVANGTSQAFISTDKAVYRQGTPLTSSEDPAFGYKEFIDFQARLFDPFGGINAVISDANCSVVLNNTESLVQLTFNSTTGNYTGQLDTFREWGNNTVNLSCISPNFGIATNSTNAAVHWELFLIETRNIFYGGANGSLANSTIFLSKMQPNSSNIVANSLNISVAPGSNNTLLRERIFCDSSTAQNCSFNRNYNLFGQTIMQLNVSASANGVCNMRGCIQVLTSNLLPILELCSDTANNITTTPTVISQTIDLPRISVVQGNFLAFHAKCDASTDLLTTTNLTVTSYLNYTDMPITVQLFNPQVLEMFTSNIRLQNFTTLLIGPNQKFNVTHEERLIFNNSQSTPLFTRYSHISETLVEFRPNILAGSIRVYNSTGDLWASDNVSAGAPNQAIVDGNDIITYDTEIIPANTVRNNTLFSTHIDAIRDNETLTLNQTNLTRWEINVFSTFEDSVDFDNVTVFTNYSKYLTGSIDGYTLNVTFTNSSGTLDITGLIVIDSNAKTITFPSTRLPKAIWYNITATDTFGPAVFDLRPTAGSAFNASDVIQIAANVTDGVAVSFVMANITFPNGTTQLLALSNSNGAKYNNSFTIPSGLTGQYNITFIANDTSNNVNNTETTFFVTGDATNPLVFGLRPVAGSVFNTSNIIEIAANVTDNIAVSFVSANITFPNGTSQVLVLANAVGSKYNGSFTIPSGLIGQYNVSFRANDTSGNINSTERTSFIVNDITPPQVFDLRPLNGTNFNISSSIEISANVTDNVGVSHVTATITYPDGATNTKVLLSVGGNKFNSSFLIPAIEGRYNVTFFANDTSNNINSTEITFFIGGDQTPPQVFDLKPINGSTFNASDVIEISANITDNFAGVGSVFANVTFPNGTSQLLALSLASGNKYNTSFTIPSLQGRYNVTFIANDTDGFGGSNVNDTESTFFIVGDAINPMVFDLRPIAGSNFNESQVIEISANVTDNGVIDKVLANITFPNGTSQLITLSPSTGNKFNSSFTIPVLLGQYNVTFIANDTNNNVNRTETTFFVSGDAQNPQVLDLRPIAGSVLNVSNIIEISANVTDNIAVSFVRANITFPNGTSQVIVLANAVGSKYNSSFTIPDLSGDYNVTFFANDTSGNINATEKTSFVVSDLAAPIITRVNASQISNDTATITWETNELSNASVQYGKNLSLGSFASNSTLVFNHTVRLPGLDANTTYYYNVTSCDTSGNCNTTGTFNFTTSLSETIAPAFVNTTVNPYAVLLGENVTLNASATDNVAVDTIVADITLPNGTVVRVLIPFNFTTSIEGIYNVSFRANDTSGNVITFEDIFLAGFNVTMQFNVIDNSTNGIDANISFFLAGTNKLARIEFVSDGLSGEGMPSGIYDMEFTALNGKIVVRLNGVNITSESNRTIGFNKISGFDGSVVTYAVNNTYNFSTANVKISYFNESFTDESLLSVQKCDNWDFTNRTCLSAFAAISAVQNTSADTFEFNVTSFSAFKIVQGSAPPPSSGGGGGRAAPEEPEVCEESWTCTAWSGCSGGISTRLCFESNSCGTSDDKPEESVGCTEVVPYCFDGVLNQDESDVDCGGDTCDARCSDAGRCYFGSDCQSGRCAAGVCAPAVLAPTPETGINWKSIFGIFIIAIALMLLVIAAIVNRRRLQEAIHFETIDIGAAMKNFKFSEYVQVDLNEPIESMLLVKKSIKSNEKKPKIAAATPTKTKFSLAALSKSIHSRIWAMKRPVLRLSSRGSNFDKEMNAYVKNKFSGKALPSVDHVVVKTKLADKIDAAWTSFIVELSYLPIFRKKSPTEKSLKSYLKMKRGEL